VRFRVLFKKGSGTVVRSTRPTFGRCPAVPATVPDPFLNHARFYAWWTVWQVLACAWCGVTAAQERTWLVRDGVARSTIVRGDIDDFAAERLQSWLKEASGAEVDVRIAGQDPLPDEGLTVLVGSAGSNRLISKVAPGAGLDIDPNRLTDQGYLAKSLRHDDRDWLILAGGGRDGAIHAVVALINWHLKRDDVHESVWFEPLDTRQVPRHRYRWLWTWDNRMDWGGPGKIVTKMGVGAVTGKYEKQPEAFLIDYKRCVDYMVDHKFNGLIIWGFLRDSHGGVEAAQELCRYAKRRGVRILPGVGTSGYAGYYYQGDNPFNVDTWLAKHPELRSIGKNGQPRGAPCPSKKANQEWLDRGAQWLFENFEIGGVNLEMGDFFVCYCDGCKRAREAISSDDPDYYKDMAISHMITLRTMRRLAPDAWLSYATYTGFSAEMAKTPPQFLSMIPEDSICQWTFTGMARQWPADVRPMARHNIGYLHWCNSSTNTENDFYLDQVRDICRQAAAVGCEGLDTYGELSDSRPNVEVSYLAWEAFLWNPEMTVEQFVETRLARLYGGPDSARALIEIIPLVQTRKDRQLLENCEHAVKLAEAAKSAASPDGRPRWDRLIGYLDGHRQTADAAMKEHRKLKADARKGEKLAIAGVKASDEEKLKGWLAAKAVDGSVDEPAGYWLTSYTSPKSAWLEVELAQPGKLNVVSLFHQLNPGHYRSLDYTISVLVDGKWKRVADVKNNELSGWVGHRFDTEETDAVRLEITRSAHRARMGVGEIEVRLVEESK
jgi:F5/8 type C domain-containing protein